MTTIQGIGGALFALSLTILVGGGRAEAIPLKCAGVAMMCYGGKRQDTDATGQQAAVAYHNGTLHVDPDEQARVQAYFAELDRRRSASGDPRYTN